MTAPTTTASPGSATSAVRTGATLMSVETDVVSLLAKLGLRDRAEAAEPSRLSSRWTAEDRMRGGS